MQSRLVGVFSLHGLSNQYASCQSRTKHASLWIWGQKPSTSVRVCCLSTIESKARFPANIAEDRFRSGLEVWSSDQKLDLCTRCHDCTHCTHWHAFMPHRFNGECCCNQGGHILWQTQHWKGRWHPMRSEVVKLKLLIACTQQKVRSRV